MACWKFQHVLKTVTHVESHVKTSRCVENVYVRHVENHIENHVEVWKKHHHTLRHVLKLSGRFCFSPSVLHELLKGDIYFSLKLKKIKMCKMNTAFTIHFFKKFLEDISPFCGTTYIPVLDSWWCLLWVSKPEWAAIFRLGWGTHVIHSMRFTCGATHANLLVTIMAAELLSSTYPWAGIGGAWNWDLLCCRQMLY